MNQKSLSFFFSNYDFKDFDATNADQGFVENHLNSQYEADERPVMDIVRRFVRELSAHPAISTDFHFDAGGHDQMWRREEGYRVNLGETLLMKVAAQMGEDGGTYVTSQPAIAQLGILTESFNGKRFAVGDDTVDYMYLFSQVRNLVSQLSNNSMFKVETERTGIAVTIMPITQGLVRFSEEAAKGAEEPTSTGTFIKIQLKNPH